MPARAHADGIEMVSIKPQAKQGRMQQSSGGGGATRCAKRTSLMV
jgi:hypothetical protein